MIRDRHFEIYTSTAADSSNFTLRQTNTTSTDNIINISYKPTIDFRWLRISATDENDVRMYVMTVYHNPEICAPAIVAVNDTASTYKNMPLAIPYKDNDTLNTSPVFTTILTAPTHGTYTIINDTIFYTPNLDVTGVLIDSIQYKLCSSGSICTTAWILININAGPCGDGYIMQTDTGYVYSNYSSTGVNNPDRVFGPPNALFAEFDNTTDILVVDLGSVLYQGLKAYLTMQPDGDNSALEAYVAISSSPTGPWLNPYTIPLPDNNAGFVEYPYTATTSGQYIRVTYNDLGRKLQLDAVRYDSVNCLNLYPDAYDDKDTTAQGTAVVIDVIANDQSDFYPLDTSSVTTTGGGILQASNGSITSINSLTGEITYTPNPGFTGTDTFEYVVCNTGGYCDTALVTVEVLCAIVVDSVAMAGYVYRDENTNQNFDNGESGEPNIKVILWNDINKNSVLNPVTDTRLDSVLTDAEGKYEFKQKMPGGSVSKRVSAATDDARQQGTTVDNSRNKLESRTKSVPD